MLIALLHYKMKSSIRKHFHFATASFLAHIFSSLSLSCEEEYAIINNNKTDKCVSCSMLIYKINHNTFIQNQKGKWILHLQPQLSNF